MYSTKYILPFENDLNEFYEIYFDYLGYVGPSMQIFGTDDCLQLTSTGGDEDKTYPLLGTECKINIVVGKVTVNGITWNNDQLTIDDIVAQFDNQIRISIYKDRDYTKTIFQGFVVVEDNSQPFLDPPFALSVRALDGLGLLKGVDLVDTSGALFSIAMSPLDWIANILYKTGQTLNIRSYFNIINTAFPSGAPIKSFTIGSDTFMIGEIETTTDPSIDLAASEADDCYTALELTVRCLRCRLFQQDGVWNLVNLYEYANPNGYSYQEFTINAPVGPSTIVTTTQIAVGNHLKYDVQVGDNQILHPVQDDAVRFLKLATKWVYLPYQYDQSQNKICNQGFEIGDADPTNNGTISSTIEDPTFTPVVTFNYNAYKPFCWTLSGGTNPGAGGGNSTNVPFPETAQTGPIYTRQVNDDIGYQYDRYLVIQSQAVANHVRSSTFKVDQGDILQVTLNFRTKNNVNAGPGVLITPMFILMYGDDGNYYGLGDTGPGAGDNQWRLCADSNFLINGVGGPANFPPQASIAYTPGTSTASWTNFTVDKTLAGAINKVPVSGTVFIILAGMPHSVPGHSGDTGESWFKDLSITIIPLLQGSYAQLKGDFNFLSSNQNIKQTFSETVEISDSPKRYFKGALLEADGETLMPLDATDGWIRKDFPSDTPKRFTQVMGTILFNNKYRQNQKIEGSVRGLMYVDSSLVPRQVGFLNSYYFSDHPVPTKKFMLTSFDKDITTGIGRHVFVEVLADQNDTGYVQPDEYDFQYVFQ